MAKRKPKKPKRSKVAVSRKAAKVVADAHRNALVDMVLALPPMTSFIPPGCEWGKPATYPEQIINLEVPRQSDRRSPNRTLSAMGDRRRGERRKA